jgi:hypothetical protein
MVFCNLAQTVVESLEGNGFEKNLTKGLELLLKKYIII